MYVPFPSGFASRKHMRARETALGHDRPLWSERLAPTRRYTLIVLFDQSVLNTLAHSPAY